MKNGENDWSMVMGPDPPLIDFVSFPTTERTSEGKLIFSPISLRAGHLVPKTPLRIQEKAPMETQIANKIVVVFIKKKKGLSFLKFRNLYYI